jgi:hypothetical protein
MTATKGEARTLAKTVQIGKKSLINNITGIDAIEADNEIANNSAGSSPNPRLNRALITGANKIIPAVAEADKANEIENSQAGLIINPTMTVTLKAATDWERRFTQTDETPIKHIMAARISES